MRGFGVVLACAFVSMVPAAHAADSAVSPGCEASLTERLDWASDYEHRLAQDGRSGDTASEMLRTAYTALELCEGESISQSGDLLHGPKASGTQPPDAFQPTGTTHTTLGKRKRRGGRTLSCSNIAFDPQFLPASDQVRAGGRSSCNMNASLSAETCLGKYFHSTGTSAQYICNPGSVYGSVITIYTVYGTCNAVTSYRSNFYGHTGNAFSAYWNGALHC